MCFLYLAPSAMELCPPRDEWELQLARSCTYESYCLNDQLKGKQTALPIFLISASRYQEQTRTHTHTESRKVMFKTTGKYREP